MKKLAHIVIGVGGILALLILAKGILIPFMYGIMLWFLGRYFKTLAYKIPLFEKHLPSWLVSSVIFVSIVLIISAIAGVASSNIKILMKSYPIYQTNINNIVDSLNDSYEIDIYQNLTEKIRNFEFGSILTTIADSISGAFGNIIMVMLYAMFIVSEELSFSLKIKQLFKNESEYKKASSILKKINTSVSDYIRLKTLVSILTGVVSYVFLFIMGVDAPFFWALLVFFLNFIPTIGSLIATVFPAVFSLLQFGEFTPFIIILVGLGIVQWIIGNILEPKIMGSSLNISPLVTILSLIVWGTIWGVTGMLISVPITVIMVIIMAQFESTKNVAIILSKNGEVD